MAVVLVVEDEIPVRTVAATILQRAGHETILTGTVDEALAVIQSGQCFDVLFTDMSLAGDAAGGIRVSSTATKSRPGLPVIYTSGGKITDEMAALFAKPRAFLPKPYTREQLIEALFDLMRPMKN